MKRFSFTTLLVCSLFFTSTQLAQKVEVTNGITEKMTKYKYLFGRYKPDEFKITVNETPMPFGEKKTFHLSDGTLNIRYDYEFKGHKKGAKVVTFEVPKEMETISFTFNWKKKNRVLIDGLDAVKVTIIEV